MIRTIKLEHFKRISSFQTDLDKINLLVGANNSGKSSVLQGIQFSIMAEVVRRELSREVVSQERLLYLPSSDFCVMRNGSPYTNTLRYSSTLELTSDTPEDNPDSFSITINKAKNFGNIKVQASGNNRFRQNVTSRINLYSAYTPGVSGIPRTESLVSKAVLVNAAANGDANLYLRNIIYYISISEDPNSNLNALNDLIHVVFPDVTLSVTFDSEKDLFLQVSFTTNGQKLPLELCGTGLLQIIHIMAYVTYFHPKLLLLDEPDEHLHPNNQIRLCEAIKTISSRLDVQMIISTHSRTLLSFFTNDAKLIWMKDGAICTDDMTNLGYDILLDLGALDEYDNVVSGRYELVVLTEDSVTKYMEKLLAHNGFDLSKVLVHSYESCSKFEMALLLGKYIHNRKPGVKIIVHRDRDFMTQDEIEIITNKITNNGFIPWLTDECDIEAYFTKPEHISELTGKSVDDVRAKEQEIINDNMVEIITSFVNKRNEINWAMYKTNDHGQRALIKKPDVLLPSPNDLINGNPTRLDVIGKFLLKRWNEIMFEFAGRAIDLQSDSIALDVPLLQRVLNELHPI